MTERSFPPGFLWGAAHAGHQVEGNNDNSDTWEPVIAFLNSLEDESL